MKLRPVLRENIANLSVTWALSPKNDSENGKPGGDSLVIPRLIFRRMIAVVCKKINRLGKRSETFNGIADE
jgi:hypothetical protein